MSNVEAPGLDLEVVEDQARLIKSVVLGSFRFSRGVYFAQNTILDFAASRLHGALSAAAFKAAAEPTAKAAKAIYSSRQHPKIKNFETDPNKVAKKFLVAFRQRVLADERPDVDMRALFLNLLTADAKYLPRRRGPQDIAGYRSNIVSFGFLDGRTDVGVFNDMFSEVGEALPQTILQARSDSMVRVGMADPWDEFKEVVQVHTAANPDDRPAVEAYVYLNILGRTLGQYPTLPATITA